MGSQEKLLLPLSLPFRRRMACLPYFSPFIRPSMLDDLDPSSMGLILTNFFRGGNPKGSETLHMALPLFLDGKNKGAQRSPKLYGRLILKVLAC